MDFWLSGFPRDTIAERNGIGAGTVSSIVANYKAGLDELEFDYLRELDVELRRHGLNLSELASHFRLYNHFIKSGTAEEEIEEFIANVTSSEMPLEKAIELVNQLFNISKEESIPLDQVPGHIKEKLEEKQQIDEDVKVADSLLESKNVSLQVIDEHLKLKEELDKYGLSTNDVDKLLSLLSNAKEYGFDSKKIMSKLHSMERLVKREKGLK